MAMAATTITPPQAEAASGCLTTDLNWLLSQASYALATELTGSLAVLGLSPRAHCVLSAALSGEYTQTEIAQAVGLDKTTMVVTIDELEREGLAERRPSASDRRARVIAVTPAGRKMVQRGRKIVQEVQEEVLETLPADERHALLAGLGRLVRDRLAHPAQCEQHVRRRRTTSP
jgi:DNA-binding MarR family transcriptional regulator